MDKRFIIFGHKQHGKDTASEYLEKTYGLSFISSSRFACELFLFEKMRLEYGYESIEECFKNRVHHRKYWYEQIRDYNSEDRTLLGRQLLSEYVIYCGIRDFEEFEAIREAGLVDLCIWIDASERKPLEDRESMTLERSQADIVVDNNGSLEDLYRRLDRLFQAMGYVPHGSE